MKIPILNIYYLLCYAWNKLDEGKKVLVSASDYNDSINLFSRVLVNGCNQLFKRGRDRNYIEVTEEYRGIKGKIEFHESLNKNLFKLGKSICTFDQFDYDILQNQLIKATLLRTLKIESVDKDLKKEIWHCYWKFSNTSDINIDLSLFSKVRIHRNNSFYDLLLKICSLIIENTVLDEQTGKYQFKEFIGSEKAMAKLFETFVRNFYKKEQSKYTVKSEDIKWDTMPIGNSSEEYLPKMQTDVTLESKDRKIIIDTKYYVEALKSRYDTEKFRSENLYQLYSYLRNIETKAGHEMNPTCEGILLYPTVDYNLNQEFIFRSHKIKIKTLNLNTDWRNIQKELLDLCSNN